MRNPGTGTVFRGTVSPPALVVQVGNRRPSRSRGRRGARCPDRPTSSGAQNQLPRKPLRRNRVRGSRRSRGSPGTVLRARLSFRLRNRGDVQWALDCVRESHTACIWSGAAPDRAMHWPDRSPTRPERRLAAAEVGLRSASVVGASRHSVCGRSSVNVSGVRPSLARVRGAASLPSVAGECSGRGTTCTRHLEPGDRGAFRRLGVAWFGVVGAGPRCGRGRR